MAALECRLSEMERLVEQLLRERQDALHETKRRAGAIKPRASRSRLSTEDMPLPEGLVLLPAFVALHTVSSNEAEKRWKAGFIHVVKQPEVGGKRHQIIALDAQGCRDFWVQFHDTPGFRPCDQCPHPVPEILALPQESAETPVAYIAPLGWEHINLIGKYQFAPQPGRSLENLRPLRLQEWEEGEEASQEAAS